MQTSQILDSNLSYSKVKYIVLNELFVQPELCNTFNILQNFSYLFFVKFHFKNHLQKLFSEEFSIMNT